MEILDPYGPTITDPDITALVISAETRAGGEAVNNKRRDRNWPALEVFTVDVLDTEESELPQDPDMRSQDFQSKLSSTEIRSRLSQKVTAPAYSEH